MDVDTRKSLLRRIPSVHNTLLEESIREIGLPKAVMKRIVCEYLENLRQKVLQQTIEDDELVLENILGGIIHRAHEQSGSSFQRVINATGVILHTGLGRAMLPSRAIKSIQRELAGYNIVEVDRVTGKRSRRDLLLKELLCDLTGAEDAVIVNNNAAAVLLALTTLAKHREVIVSNGQLVEIGGSFRVPEIIAESGAELVSVGCTNKVHLFDYQRAISDRTAALLHVHTSNFKVLGFTQEVELAKLSQLAKENSLVLIEDAGSGSLLDLSRWGYHGEPVISKCIQAGADVVTFSGDKLLGGCQAGIIVGKADLLEQIRCHPLARALRVDKMTLVVLEATLKLYQDESSLFRENPTLRMLTLEESAIRERAQSICQRLSQEVTACEIRVIPACSRVGSGALPVCDIPSHAVAVSPKNFSVKKLARLLRTHNPPVFARLSQDMLLIDPRTLKEDEDEEIINILKRVMCA